MRSSSLFWSWFIPRDTTPWERVVLQSLATAVSTRGLRLDLLMEGRPLSASTTFAWDASSGLDRLSHILFSGRFWHFWGRAPHWARFVRLRARCVHTQWRTQEPSVGLASSITRPSDGTECTFFPTFDSALLWNESVSPPVLRSIEGGLAILSPFRRRPSRGAEQALRKHEGHLHWIAVGSRFLDGGEELPLDEKLFAHWRERGGALVLPSLPEAGECWLAAEAALMAVPCVAPKSPLLDELLGEEGYLAVSADRSGDPSAWSRAFSEALSSRGRASAAQARRRIENNSSPELAASQLLQTYTSLGGWNS